MKKVSIQDVAAAAGVSTATVDRVLNNRQGVHPKTTEKVKLAILKLNYQTKALITKFHQAKICRILFIVPVGQTTFMRRLGQCIDEFSLKLKDEKVYIEKRLVNAFDGTEAAGLLDEITLKDWDGVAVVVPDLPLVRQAIDSCVGRGVKVVTVVSDLPSSARSFFVGIDNIAAGRVAGRLLGRFTSPYPGNLAVVMASLSLRDHAERHIGCVQVVQADFPHLNVLPPYEGLDNPEDTFRVVSEMLASSSGEKLKAIYSSGGASQGLIEALHQSGRQNEIVTVCHELTPRSRRALLDGTFDVILNQDVEHEVQRTITLLRQLCDNQQIERPGFIWTDIFLPDNLP